MADSPVARLALPFTDLDLAGKTDVRMNIIGVGEFTATLDLPSVGGVDGAYYNGGDLGNGLGNDVATNQDSLIMAFAKQTNLDITEDPLLPGRYILSAQGTPLEILWLDPITTADPAWFGFAPRTATSDGNGFLTADYQADRLWIARHPRWNRKKRVREGSLVHGYSDDDPPQARLLGNGRTPWQLFFSMVSGPRVYLWDAQDVLLAAHVSGAVAGSIAVSATIADGGTVYAVDDKLLLVGGTTGAAAVYNVDTEAAGVVLSVSADDTVDDIYTERPLNPVATTTGGGGSDCTLNITWAAGDPNICFQSLWEFIATRLPLKVIEDDTRLVEFEFCDPDSTDLLGDLDTIIRSTRSEAPPYYEVLIPLSVRPS